MTQKEWEKKLKKFLKPLPKAEREQIVEYYREMYGDRLDAGFSETEILAEFGDPQVCAGRMISENVDVEPTVVREFKTKPEKAPLPNVERIPAPVALTSAGTGTSTGTGTGNPYLKSASREKRVGNPYLVSNREGVAENGVAVPCAGGTTAGKGESSGVSKCESVGTVLFTVLLGLPLGLAALIVLIAFGAVTVSGAVVAIAGVLFAIACPFFAFTGLPAAGIVANVGLGLACGGAGAVLFVGFFLATKYVALGAWKAVRFIYLRRNGQ